MPAISAITRALRKLPTSSPQLAPLGLSQHALMRVKPQSQQSQVTMVLGSGPVDVDMELMVCQASHHTQDSARREMQERSKLGEKPLG